MTATAEAQPPMKLSAKFVACEGEPLTGVDLLTGCESLEGRVVKAALALSENGGAKRTRIRPVIKTVGDASAVELADQLHAIAWADCMERGKASRYVAELSDVDGETHRVYFNLTPTVDALEVEGATDRPSLEYVRGLENLVLNLTRDNNITAQRHSMTEGKRIDLAWAGVNRVAHTEIARGQVRIAEVEAAGRNSRRDKVFDGVVALLPKLADKYLPAAAPAMAALDSSAKPVDRVRELVTGEQFDAFRKSLGDLFEPFEQATDLEAARLLLADMSKAQQTEVLEAIGRENVVTIATWK